MSVTPEQARRMKEAWLNEKTQDWKDFWLDRYNELCKLATPHDASMWGFDAVNWMLTERLILAGRGGTDWPKERS